MRNFINAITILTIFAMVSPAYSAEGHGEHGAASSSKTSSAMPEGTYGHKDVVDGIRAEFQIMSLESMNMKDPKGATHHIMLRLFHDKMNHPIDKVVGKIKVVAPSGKEQIATLKDYNGIFAANFAFTEKGKYGVICLFKENGKKHVVKFWYPHS